MPNKKGMSKRDPFRIERDPHSYIAGKMVGGNIPLPQVEYLHLLATYYELSIQGVLQKIISEWMEGKEPIDCILENLVDRALMEWSRRLCEGADWSMASQNKYLEEVKSYLEKHKIQNKDHVNQIIKHLRMKIGLV